MRAESLNDERRVAALRQYGILDTEREREFDSIVELAAKICETPVSLISLLDADRQWFKAEVGMGLRETPISASFCAYTVKEGGLFEVTDTQDDLRFKNNPLVVGGPRIRFYAGAPLTTPEGVSLGSLCVLDTQPRELTPLQRETLTVLSSQVIAQLELRRKVLQLEEAQEKTRERDEFLRIVTDRMPVRVGYIDRDFRYVFLNGEYERQFGFRPGEAWGHKVEEIVGLAAFALAKPHIDRALAGESHTVEFDVPYPQGSRRILADFVPDFSPEGYVRGVVTHALDVTDQAIARKRVGQSEEQFRTVFQSAPDAILLMDTDRCVLAWNPAAQTITGWPPHEIVGLLGDVLFTEEDLATGMPEREAETAATYGKAVDERWHARKDGTRFWASGTMNALYHADGTLRGFLKVFRDATERYQFETRIKEMNEQLEHRVRERTEELEEAVREAEAFNYSISHDLRAPLRAIVSTSSILKEDLGEQFGREYALLLDRQVHNANRLGRLIDELLRLSRLARTPVQRERLDMTQKALMVAAELDPERKIEVQGGMTGQGDAALIRTVYQNLIGNAFKFSPTESVVRVGKTGDVFWVRDEGIGFEMQYASKVFLPFERLVTEAEFEGTGIGLANVERIVRRHGGKVWAESEPGKGTTFFFTLGSEG